MADRAPGRRRAGLVHGGSEAVDARAAAQDAGRPADHGDPPVAQAQQVARRRQAAVPVGGADRRGVVHAARRQGRRRRTGSHGPAAARASPRPGPRTPRSRPSAGGRGRPRSSPGRAVWRPCSSGQHDGQAVASGDALDAAHDLQAPLALELVEDELDQRCPALPRPGALVAAASRMTASTRRRVAGATSDRPLMTLETVGTGHAGLAAMHGDGRAAAAGVRRRRACVMARQYTKSANSRKFRCFP